MIFWFFEVEIIKDLFLITGSFKGLYCASFQLSYTSLPQLRIWCAELNSNSLTFLLKFLLFSWFLPNRNFFSAEKNEVEFQEDWKGQKEDYREILEGPYAQSALKINSHLAKNICLATNQGEKQLFYPRFARKKKFFSPWFVARNILFHV